MDDKKAARLKRKQRIRKKVGGTAERPRLSVFRSARHIYAQVIDDSCGRTLVAASSLEAGVRALPRFDSKVALATHIGQVLAERAMAQGIRKVVFDRNGFLYHGRIKAVSEGARKAGLDF
jgi:large subunit ribosomal protein L18